MKHLKEDQAISTEIAIEFGEGWIPPEPIIGIVAPSAYPGDQVIFFNYRAKYGAQQTGKVIHVETHWGSATEFYHRYKVKPDNRNYTVVVRSVELIESDSTPPPCIICEEPSEETICNNCSNR